MRPAVKHSYGEEAFKKKKELHVVKAPLPGSVLRINVKEGDEVNRVIFFL